MRAIADACTSILALDNVIAMFSALIHHDSHSPTWIGIKTPLLAFDDCKECESNPAPSLKIYSIPNWICQLYDDHKIHTWKDLINYGSWFRTCRQREGRDDSPLAFSVRMRFATCKQIANAMSQGLFSFNDVIAVSSTTILRNTVIGFEKSQIIKTNKTINKT
jgi:hypothetical protein